MEGSFSRLTYLDFGQCVLVGSIHAPGAAYLPSEEAQFCCPLVPPLPTGTEGISIPASTRQVAYEKNMALKVDGQ